METGLKISSISNGWLVRLPYGSQPILSDDFLRHQVDIYKQELGMTDDVLKNLIQSPTEDKETDDNIILDKSSGIHDQSLYYFKTLKDVLNFINSIVDIQ